MRTFEFYSNNDSFHFQNISLFQPAGYVTRLWRLYILHQPVYTGILWHHSYGHISSKNLLEMRIDRPRNDFPARQVMKNWKLLHADLCSLFEQNIDMNRYIINAIDDYSSLCFIGLLQYKSEATDYIINLIQRIETQNNTRVKCLHSDNCTEFSNQWL